VRYKDGAQAKLDLLAGRVDMLFTDLTVIDDVKQGRLRAIITTAPRRLTAMLELPTATEAGLLRFDRTGCAPGNIGSEIVEPAR
jgi:tripartite-type tricarboxylate transporter receptor subunit TctC